MSGWSQQPQYFVVFKWYFWHVFFHWKCNQRRLNDTVNIRCTQFFSLKFINNCSCTQYQDIILLMSVKANVALKTKQNNDKWSRSWKSLVFDEILHLNQITTSKSSIFQRFTILHLVNDQLFRESLFIKPLYKMYTTMTHKLMITKSFILVVISQPLQSQNTNKNCTISYYTTEILLMTEESTITLYHCTINNYSFGIILIKTAYHSQPNIQTTIFR